jgi:ubiquinone/menaquinone biosynthesis C-methylase UbiE
LLSRQKIRRVVRSVLGLPDNTTHKYWEQVAKENPYSAICTGWEAGKFDSESDNPVMGSEFLTSDMVVLDVACGIGRLAKFIAPKVKQYVGVDFSSGMIEKAKERYQGYANVSFFQNDGKSLAVLADNTFDIALCSLAFQHMTRAVTKSYIDEVHRVLKPGGMFFTDIPRLEYYKDDKFAFTKAQTSSLFNLYSSTEYRPETGQAYYIIRATK